MKNVPDQHSPLLIGVISDTHGLLRPQATAALQGCHLILHAGDVGRPEILDDLRLIAPLVAVRGNVDRGSWAAALAEKELVEAGGRYFYLLHQLDQLDIDPVAAGVAAVISGHSHIPRMKKRGGILYFNPGSAGPKRWNLPVSVGLLKVVEGLVEGQIIELQQIAEKR
ncbi:MAG: metallophosphoesterase family protein [Desulfuromonadaceae bacterium]|jgi:putative phosphoesterase|nr:metallophosphoesterase family protein [Desulfuromonadaceae bacterium]